MTVLIEGSNHNKHRLYFIYENVSSVIEVFCFTSVYSKIMKYSGWGNSQHLCITKLIFIYSEQKEIGWENIFFAGQKSIFSKVSIIARKLNALQNLLLSLKRS